MEAESAARAPRVRLISGDARRCWAEDRRTGIAAPSPLVPPRPGTPDPPRGLQRTSAWSPGLRPRLTQPLQGSVTTPARSASARRARQEAAADLASPWFEEDGRKRTGARPNGSVLGLSARRGVLVGDEPLAVLFGQEHREASRARDRLAVLHPSKLVEAGRDHRVVGDDDGLALLDGVLVAAPRQLEIGEVGPNCLAALGDDRAVRAEEYRIRRIELNQLVDIVGRIGG